MPTFTKRGRTWRVQIRCKGVKLSATFDTKAQATAWAAKKEAEIRSGAVPGLSDKTVADAFHRYATAVSVQKRGAVWEHRRIAAFCRDFPALAEMKLAECRAPHFTEWREARLKTVSTGTVIREMNLFSHIFSIARDEWEWIAASPLTGVRRPKEPKPRDRRVSAAELERLLLVLGYTPDESPITMSSRVGAAFLFAIETGMRAGEMMNLTWPRVFLEKRYVHLDKTKNGFARDVALSPLALKILKQLHPLKDDLKNSVFGLTSASLDALFRKAKNQAGIVDLHFHDTRHEAITCRSKDLI